MGVGKWGAGVPLPWIFIHGTYIVDRGMGVGSGGQGAVPP